MPPHPRKALGQALSGAVAMANNALEIARFGGLDTGEEPSPYEVAHGTSVYRLRHYFADLPADDRPAVLLVPPLMLSAEVYDVAPASSAVRSLADAGVDPWVVDFGAPEREPGGLERTLADHVIGVSEAIDVVRELRGRDLHLSGYSQGGMFCYQTAAYRRSDGLASIITFGSPVDVTEALPLGIPADMAKLVAAVLEAVLAGRALPAWASRLGFRLLDPAKSLRQQVEFVLQLHDREALLPRERQRRFLDSEGWVAYPGPAIADLLEQFVVHNRMVSGGFVIEDRVVTLADIDCPVLCFVGEVDEIAPAKMVRAVRRAAPRAATYEIALRSGHFGLVVGSAAAERTWPAVADWIHWQEDGASDERPAGIEPMREAEESGDGPSTPLSLAHSVELAAGVGFGAVRSTLRTANRSQRALRSVAGEALEQLPRLARLERTRAGTRISIGLLLDEQAQRAPDGVFFLWEDRAYTHAAVKARIDAVVRGLVSLGVRQGERVGVLMATRPSGLAVTAALNRIGAVVVLMRSLESAEREAEIGAVTRVITDPEHGAELRDRLGVPVLVLGGGAEPRELGPGLVDMERIDPDAVELPAWYRPNPGRARDLGFVLFTGQGDGTRANRITNRRWALSAFGTASTAALSPSDTVYSVAPLHHPAGLLTGIGGAVAGGARLAIASAFAPDTFWEEVRRYGASIVTYTWTQLDPLLRAPRHPGERHHPVRLFVGSGMPVASWRGVLERFAPAGVLEFYASTEGEAVLVNLSGKKIGAKGRPLPGATDVRVARYDPVTGGLALGPGGLAVACGVDEVGMLLARVDPDGTAVPGIPLRGVFAPGDAWLATGDLFRRDADGDHWLAGQAAELVPTAGGPVPTVPVEDALGAIHAVSLALAYGVPSGREGVEQLVAAVTLRPGRRLRATDLAGALAVLAEDQRPEVVRVVEKIPVTSWFRPRKEALRAEGIPAPTERAFAWRRDPGGEIWRPLVERRATPRRPGSTPPARSRRRAART